ncbi:hypothetical protein BT96DRAFT_462405 [Gymnopus androsaceus JB14]|uniref:Uncharacterized protein n=1 Tax=Gymnopus androsaceus JB14 TaxID=1447944 RepID=A0A6A4INN3_9AGAR|nr:hypothetical protein BT96DRAFT_462405 [Gymnopus androsaceus JB14]
MSLLAMRHPPALFFSLTASENSYRWRRVKITAPESFVTTLLQTLNDGRGGLPGLVSLSIDDILPFPLSCPKLQSLSLEYPQLTVTELNLTGLTAEEISHCSNVGTRCTKIRLVSQSLAPPSMISCSAPSLVLDFRSSLSDAIAVFM